MRRAIRTLTTGLAPLAWSLGPTQTDIHTWFPNGTGPSVTDGTTHASVRIVSSMSVSATLGHDLGSSDRNAVVCTPREP